MTPGTRSYPSPADSGVIEFDGNLPYSHYENFPLASLILPRTARQDLFVLYNFARLADDFADEDADTARAAVLLDAWELELTRCLSGGSPHPLFSRIGEMIRRRNLTPQYFYDLLNAFRMDLTVKRYPTWDDLLTYTRLSANPVGRLILELFRCQNDENFALSDKICTALQLANHWQDVLEDHRRGRIYLPQEDMAKFGVTDDNIEGRTQGEGFVDLMKFQVGRARRLFREGKPLLRRLKGAARLQVALYWAGGVAALDCIERIHYDVLNKSARLSRMDKRRAAFRAAMLALGMG